MSVLENNLNMSMAVGKEFYDILGKKELDELARFGKEVANEIQKKYKPSYAEAELILAVAQIVLKNVPLNQVDLTDLPILKEQE